MPPKVKITKEDIVSTALAIVKKEGEQGINARNIASKLGCSTQPIFYNFNSMEELMQDVIKKVEAIFSQYLCDEIERKEFPQYKATGVAYIRFAMEESELFKFLYMRNQAGESMQNDTKFFDQSVEFIEKNMGLNKEMATIFHLESWLFVHGIASVIATGFLSLEWDLISKMISDFYNGIKNKFTEKV